MIYKLEKITLTPYYNLAEMQDMMRNVNTEGSQQGRLFSFYSKESNDTNIIFALLFNSGGKDKIIGRVSLEEINYINRTAELKVFILPAYTKKGHAFEACKTAIEHGFEQLGLNRLEAGTLENNEGFQKLASKLGMIEEGRRKKAVWKNGGFLDVIEYGILRGEKGE